MPGALDIRVPRNLTAVMQHLQLLVGREGYRVWCGGCIEPRKLQAFVERMAVRYPLLRNTRQRSYDRKRGRAVVHFVAFAMDERIQWWLLSDERPGGLADPASPDAHVAHDAMSAQHHLTVGDYVLLYATKKEQHTVTDRRTGKPKGIVKDTSTWTWKLQGSVVSSLRAAVDECCRRLDYGHEGDEASRPWGLRGLLATQRRRPLFSGVRNQVIDLHRYARDAWTPARDRWLLRHPDLAKRYELKAGALRPLNEVIANHLPIMPRLAVYGEAPTTLRALCERFGGERTESQARPG